jgi:ferredoxin-NADP reductase
VLPKDHDQKIVFIAGGIGITPFRSMTKYLLDTQEARDITLLYSARTANDFAYKEVFDHASKEMDMKAVYVVTDSEADTSDKRYCYGHIDAALIQKEVPDCEQRLFYISGTQAMVVAMRQQLADIGVPRHLIKVDYFSGYA